jgi:glyoxylase-like metal-dependent hydrolase (beta-lactamase superfamily II)
MFLSPVQEWSEANSIMGIYFINPIEVPLLTYCPSTHYSLTKILVEKGRKIRDINFLVTSDTVSKLTSATESLSIEYLSQEFFMAISSYQAIDLFRWLMDKEDIVVLDVRNEKDFSRSHVESPYPFELHNISYYDFMEGEQEAIARVPANRRIRIVCAKEGSAKYVAEILDNNGFADVGYLSGGFKSWGNMLVPKLVADEEGYQLYQFIRPAKASCSYGLLYNKEMMVFDPSRNIDFYLDFAAEKGCTLTKTFETHLQADYISGSRAIAEKTGATFYANEGDFGGSNNPYTPVNDGESHCFTDSDSGPKVKVLFTPGHTPGSTSYIINEKYMISGDTVFISSVGRPDLGGQAESWATMLYTTIGMIQQLDKNLAILPGHYMNWEEANDALLFTTSLGDAIERNKAIYSIASEKEFIQFIKENMRPQPEEYAVIRLVNANKEEVDSDRAEVLDIGKNECAATAYAKAQAEKEAAS